jgi:hypothetical protein
MKLAAALVAAWLAAQNAGDFERYQSFYARDFRGVRRSGERVVELDRARWMKERARMFANGFAVRGDDPVIEPRPDGTITVRLHQRWWSDTYMDRGEKQLLLAMEGGQLRIVREEQLSSIKADPDVTPLDDRQAEVLRCLSDDIVPRWRIADDRLVRQLATGQHDGMTALWVRFDEGSTVALCRGRKPVARLDDVLIDAYSIDDDSFSIEGDDLDVRADRKAFALVDVMGRPPENCDADAPECDEHMHDGRRMAFFARDGKWLRMVWQGEVRFQLSLGEHQGDDWSCDLSTGKRDRTGWNALVRECESHGDTPGPPRRTVFHFFAGEYREGK